MTDSIMYIGATVTVADGYNTGYWICHQDDGSGGGGSSGSSHFLISEQHKTHNIGITVTADSSEINIYTDKVHLTGEADVTYTSDNTSADTVVFSEDVETFAIVKDNLTVTTKNATAATTYISAIVKIKATEGTTDLGNIMVLGGAPWLYLDGGTSLTANSVTLYNNTSFFDFTHTGTIRSLVDENGDTLFEISDIVQDNNTLSLEVITSQGADDNVPHFKLFRGDCGEIDWYSSDCIASNDDGSFSITSSGSYFIAAMLYYGGTVVLSSKVIDVTITDLEISEYRIV